MLPTKEGKEWAEKLGRPDLRYFIEDAIDFSGYAWDKASEDDKRKYLEFMIAFTEKIDGGS